MEKHNPILAAVLLANVWHVAFVCMMKGVYMLLQLKYYNSITCMQLINYLHLLFEPKLQTLNIITPCAHAQQGIAQLVSLSVSQYNVSVHKNQQFV